MPTDANISANADGPTDAVVCLITAPAGHAPTIAAAAVQRRLAACVNVVAPVQSIYRWQDAVQTDEESLLIVKTTQDSLQEVEQLLRELHPYDTFELVALPVSGGSARYLEWIGASVGPVS